MSFAPGAVAITCKSEPSWGYRLWSSTNMEDGEPVETREGTGADITFTPPVPEGETKRFWRIEYVEGGF